MFDFFWRLLGYTLKKDVRKEYLDRKIKEEQDIVTFERIAKETPSFSRCVITKERSQKQKSQQRTYAAATKEGPVPQSPPLPIRKSKRIISKK
tara:strand:+ start:388 stop:666 length:279 start_codon:yes stop_codon:yes gene_type:complete